MNIASSGEPDTSPKKPLTSSTAIRTSRSVFAHGYFMPPSSQCAERIRRGYRMSGICLSNSRRRLNLTFVGSHHFDEFLHGVGRVLQGSHLIVVQIELNNLYDAPSAKFHGNADKQIINAVFPL